MKFLLGMIVLFILLAAGGCQSIGQVDTAIQKNLPQICRAADVAHTAFTAVAVTTDRVPMKTVRVELAAYTSLQDLCADPSNATSVNVLITATSAYMQIAQALKVAEKVEK